MKIVEEFKTIFNTYLSEQSFNNPPIELYTPINYIMEMGGKRLRPILVLLGNHLFNEDIKAALPVAYAAELFHNFSLVHDDIMDNAFLRRKQATVHQKFGLNAGILSGDVMLVYTYHYLSSIEDKVKSSKIIHIFNDIAIKVCEGQQMDMNFEERSHVSLPEYLKMIEFKTAVLIAGSLSMGAVVGNASSEDVFHLKEFGRYMGIAFQLQDDILDAYGDQKKFGKKVGGDIIQNKKTYLVTKALERADSKTGLELISQLNNAEISPDTKVKNVLAIFDELHILDHAEIAKNEFFDKGIGHLEKVNANVQKKKILSDLSLSLLNRNK